MMADRGKLEAAVFDAMMPVSCQNDKTGAAVSTCSVVTDIVNAIEEVLREPADPPRPFTPEQVDAIEEAIQTQFVRWRDKLPTDWKWTQGDGRRLITAVRDAVVNTLTLQPPAERETLDKEKP